jgi:hypothetical protein
MKPTITVPISPNIHSLQDRCIDIQLTNNMSIAKSAANSSSARPPLARLNFNAATPTANTKQFAFAKSAQSPTPKPSVAASTEGSAAVAPSNLNLHSLLTHNLILLGFDEKKLNFNLRDASFLNSSLQANQSKAVELTFYILLSKLKSLEQNIENSLLKFDYWLDFNIRLQSCWPCTEKSQQREFINLVFTCLDGLNSKIPHLFPSGIIKKTHFLTLNALREKDCSALSTIAYCLSVFVIETELKLKHTQFFKASPSLQFAANQLQKLNQNNNSGQNAPISLKLLNFEAENHVIQMNQKLLNEVSANQAAVQAVQADADQLIQFSREINGHIKVTQEKIAHQQRKIRENCVVHDYQEKTELLAQFVGEIQQFYGEIQQFLHVSSSEERVLHDVAVGKLSQPQFLLPSTHIHNRKIDLNDLLLNWLVQYEELLQYLKGNKALLKNFPALSGNLQREISHQGTQMAKIQQFASQLRQFMQKSAEVNSCPADSSLPSTNSTAHHTIIAFPVTPAVDYSIPPTPLTALSAAVANSTASAQKIRNFNSALKSFEKKTGGNHGRTGKSGPRKSQKQLDWTLQQGVEAPETREVQPESEKQHYEYISEEGLLDDIDQQLELLE